MVWLLVQLHLVEMVHEALLELEMFLKNAMDE